MRSGCRATVSTSIPSASRFSAPAGDEITLTLGYEQAIAAF